MYLDLIINNNTELKSYKAFLDAYHDGLFILSKDAISWFCIPDDLYDLSSVLLFMIRSRYIIMLDKK